MSTNLNAFVVADPNKCIGCKVCEVACSVAHTDKEFVTAGMIDTPLIAKLYLVKTLAVTMPVQCRQCENAPCAQVCPVAAITQINDRIVIDETDCIGCKTCLMVCPFGAIDIVPVYRDGEMVSQSTLKVKTAEGFVEKERVVASKCDLCAGRSTSPACVTACPEKALEMIVPKQEKKQRNVDAAVNLLNYVKKFVE
ncbi:electron transport protein HydN [Sporomusaceae bacterium BoRhaA]|uniref:4Fe-4S dicluster domain-containing protein n=1 Tax=Pelorhabdus rhamnosifermentans TaxID=2772457 RepID=UPI001C062695|nr:4Fe-4S dicluster domain-containing protein [Pelorhabdus rhamnosifermentans]MBU2703104.1 electron transport protein HydN [Pelorhabdus rhamnosifermentans]